VRTSRCWTGAVFPPQAETLDKGHGRIETRRIWLREDLADYLTFPHAKVVFQLERERTKLDGTSPTREVVYGLTDRPGTGARAATELLALVRGHWTVENKLHWVRDVTYDEDRSQVRKGNGPRVMASLRNIAISLLRIAGAENIASATRWCSRHVDLCPRLLGFAV
jgi:hypothetical protein